MTKAGKKVADSIAEKRGYERGREEERALIEQWLREDDGDVELSGKMFARMIERRAHLKWAEKKS